MKASEARTCEQLGVCQQRAEQCANCYWRMDQAEAEALAVRSIEVEPPPPRRWAKLVRDAVVLPLMVAVICVFALTNLVEINAFGWFR